MYKRTANNLWKLHFEIKLLKKINRANESITNVEDQARFSRKSLNDYLDSTKKKIIEASKS